MDRHNSSQPTRFSSSQESRGSPCSPPGPCAERVRLRKPPAGSAHPARPAPLRTRNWWVAALALRPGGARGSAGLFVCVHVCGDFHKISSCVAGGWFVSGCGARSARSRESDAVAVGPVRGRPGRLGGCGESCRRRVPGLQRPGPGPAQSRKERGGRDPPEPPS